MRVLIVEDSVPDTQLIEWELQRAGYETVLLRVETASALIAALDETTWDLIISDYSLPQLNAPAVAKLLQARSLDLPLIVISGTVGEDVAVGMLKAGAHDYVMKDDLMRLGPAVARELREAEARIEQGRMQQALAESEARFRRIVETAQEGIWSLDAHNLTTFVNSRMAALLGYSVEAMQGRPLVQFLSDPDGPETVAAIERWRSGSPEQHDVALRLQDGSEVWTICCISPIADDSGLYAGVLIMLTDITERRQTEAALRASEERFRKQYKGIPLPTYSWLHTGDDFILQDYNDAAEAITSGQVRDWLGNRASEQYAERPDSMASMQMCFAERRTIRRETHYRLPNTGQERHLALSYVFVPPLTVMVHTEDITESKQAEQQRDALAQSEKLRALGQMATGIAHDINQSLMLVASYSDLARQALDNDPPDLEELRDLFLTATQAALDGGETVKRLLLFTRASVEQDRQPVDLTAIIRDASQLTAPRWRDAAQAEGRPISMHLETDGHPTTQGSPGRIREVMTNLIFNAVDALPNGGRITLRVLSEGEHAIVEVIDSGLGMSAEVQARVFEPFFTTKGEGGTGLGLSMVFGIVEQHGGHIDVRSAPGLGTTFRISLPRVEEPAAREPSRVPLVPLLPARPLRVLAVDDEPAMTKAVVRMLRPVGHVVSVAGSGEEALEQLTGDAYDVVVSDVGMGPGMNGWDLAAEVKRRFPDIRFILATGWGAAIDPAEARAKGVETVLAKPYRPGDLQQAVAGLDKLAA